MVRILLNYISIFLVEFIFHQKNEQESPCNCFVYFPLSGDPCIGRHYVALSTDDYASHVYPRSLRISAQLFLVATGKAFDRRRPEVGRLNRTCPGTALTLNTN